MIFVPQQEKEYSESAIRPDDLKQKWRALLKEEVERWLQKKPSDFMESDCPGCGSLERSRVFKIFGFFYYLCSACGTYYSSPRPTQEALDEFYKNSAAVKFWKEEVIKKTIAERRVHHLKPQANWIIEMARAYHPKACVALDYKPKFYSVFEEVAVPFEKLVFLSPLHLEKGDAHKLARTAQSFGDLDEQVDIITAFNVLERETDPAKFLREAKDNLCQGGLLFLTTNVSSGFEYQVLGGDSPNLVPPDRLNLLPIEAVENLLYKAGFEILDLGTPGKLDVDIVAKEFALRPDLPMPSFLKYIFKNRNRTVLNSLQNFLQLNNLSSFLRAVAIKR